MHWSIGNNDTEPEGRGLFLWDRTMGLLEQEMAWRRRRIRFVTLKGDTDDHALHGRRGYTCVNGSCLFQGG